MAVKQKQPCRIVILINRAGEKKSMKRKKLTLFRTESNYEQPLLRWEYAL